ncbi:Ger(x)C family spore germination protein [Paenibacillus rhizovicinus]|uniref:Ger(X)C family spore germination protein n=1 Tax=Paenibacillus rhizovicinus TaxID=2704463 RepID=A0A6C0NT83_9BACL|nr:Ger(x)C family spore germination protein [Paenibacillus rhizovicinus]QHW29404.1 Ger(x)C family spore germination protein [Paenibacillus rhizovicinus]
MIRNVALSSVVFLFLLSITSCTDFVEPNQLAFVMGSAIDYAEGGLLEVSHQIVIPSQLKGSSSGKVDQYIVVSAKGKNVFEASQKIQLKLSRRLMVRHRILIAFGEKFVRQNDMSLIFDKIIRDPSYSMRDTILLIRGGSAKEFLMQKHPIEFLSSVSADKELQTNGLGGFSARKLIIESVSEGIRPLMPFLQFEKFQFSSNKKTPIAVLRGFAVLDKNQKIKCFLNESEGTQAVWMRGQGTYDGITIPWKDGKGLLSFRLTHIKRRLGSHEPNSVNLTIKAQAYLLENSTTLNMAEVDNMIAVQQYLNAALRKQLQGTINIIQQKGTDVLGVGKYLHHKYPIWWMSQHSDWDNNFKNIKISAQSNIQLRSIGTTSIPIKEIDEKRER